MKDYIEVKSNGRVRAKKGTNTRTPYHHQKDAMRKLSIINEEKSFSTLVVLPTGGGKTYTASTWLLKNAIDQKKKILWIAHRQMLLDQAAESFQKFAYAEVMPHISEFTYRIVSGSSSHDRSIDITAKDNILILSKDSIGRNLDRLDCWLKGEKELFVIVDEAHHSTAKTYRKILDYVKQKVENVKLIGLTATPFRTSESEAGLLAQIYKDGVNDKDQVVKNDLGITYQIGLKDLINNRILSKPIFESNFTDEDYGEEIGLDALERIQYLDVIPDELADRMAQSAVRNKLIVDTYLKKANEYGQTIVFAVSIAHAIVLSKLFNNAGVAADYVISSVKDAVTGVTVSREDNERKLQDYRDGKLQVLINVNILTEGVDLPQTKTVFLARPTVSKILMTQMVGRALRGTAAGGTSEAYIVSFVDQWNEHISWCNPESIFGGDGKFSDDTRDYERRDINLIAISKIEEFASLLDENVDTTALEKAPFISRIPIGMYAFSYLQDNGMDLSYQVMVYDSTKEAYKQLMLSLSTLFAEYGVDEEYPSVEILEKMEEHCHDTFFCGEMIPPYEKRDVINILKYYAQYDAVPAFYTFDEVDASKLDVSKIAQHIWDEDMGARKKAEYTNELWNNSDENMLKMFFGRKTYFLKQLDIEIMKIAGNYDEDEENVTYGVRQLEDMSLSEIRKVRPDYEKELRDEAFEKSKNKKGLYECAICHMTASNRIPFQVDHIVPMNQGGKTKSENLQILCRKCNGTKGDK
ncbi:DEAD/DEAH box helicase family protein [Bariatricus sp. HCP3S3_E12]|uniref:DEAD/DEAH box helicase family protein n=1 Tax=Bariatricus sp. HCP3S3_E12 TaxID=3438906 RepID=UPI003F8A7B88